MRNNILVSTLPLIISIILIVIVGNFGIPKVLDLRTQISNTQVDKATLTQKLSVLTSVSQTVASGVNTVTTALPQNNPSLVVLTQVKVLSSSQGVLLSNLKSGSEIKDTSGGLSRVDVSFDATGSRAQIFSFLKSIENIAPITLVDKVKITESGGASLANITVKSFWAPLPKSLPAITTPIDNLTPDEIKTLTEISNLTQPIFLEVPANSEGGKSDPFGQ